MSSSFSTSCVVEIGSALAAGDDRLSGRPRTTPRGDTARQGQFRAMRRAETAFPAPRESEPQVSVPGGRSGECGTAEFGERDAETRSSPRKVLQSGVHE